MKHKNNRFLTVLFFTLLVSCTGLSRTSQNVQLLSNSRFELPLNQDGSVPGWEVRADSSHTLNLLTEYRQFGESYQLVVSQDGTVLGAQRTNAWIQRIENVQPGRRYTLYFEFSTVGVSSEAVELGISFLKGQEQTLYEKKWNPDISGTEPLFWAETEGYVPPGCASVIVSAGLSRGSSGTVMFEKAELVLYESVSPKDANRKVVIEGGLYLEGVFEDNRRFRANVDLEHGCWNIGGDTAMPCTYRLNNDELTLTLVDEKPIRRSDFTEQLSGGGYNIYIQGSFTRRDGDQLSGVFTGKTSKENPYNYPRLDRIPGTVSGYLTRHRIRVEALSIWIR